MYEYKPLVGVSGIFPPSLYHIRHTPYIVSFLQNFQQGSQINIFVLDTFIQNAEIL